MIDNPQGCCEDYVCLFQKLTMKQMQVVYLGGKGSTYMGLGNEQRKAVQPQKVCYKSPVSVGNESQILRSCFWNFCGILEALGLSHLRSEGAALFIHFPLWSLVEGCSQGVFVSQQPKLGLQALE